MEDRDGRALVLLYTRYKRRFPPLFTNTREPRLVTSDAVCAKKNTRSNQFEAVADDAIHVSSPLS